MTIPFRHDPRRAGLIVVDVQNDFCSPRGSLARLGYSTEMAVAMVQRLRTLIDAAHTAKVPVIFIQTLHDETTDTPQWLGRVGTGPDTDRTGLTCRTGTWGAEFFEIEPRAGDLVVTKNRFSAFIGTNLEIVLRTLGIESLLFTGVSTNICVESSLRDALFHEFWVTLVHDCCGAFTRKDHEASKSVVAENFGTLTTSSDLIADWEKQ